MTFKCSGVDHGPLEKEFNAQLNEARRIGIHDLPKRGAADIAVDGLGSEELGMIEDVEPLHSKLKRFRFSSNARS